MMKHRYSLLRHLLLAPACCLALATSAQRIGIGTATPATRLDIAGTDGWDLQNGEGDLRLGNGVFRLKMGVALGGSGAGAVGIMQMGVAGGYNVLSLGAQGSYLLRLNGTLGRIGIGTDGPEAMLDIRSAGAAANPQLQLWQNNGADFARLRLKNANSGSNTRYWDVAGTIASGAGTQASDYLHFFAGGLNQNVLSLRGNGLVGIGTSQPATRLDVAGTDAWDLINGEGDLRIGNASTRLKMGIALGGGGVGAAGIMQSGGIGALSLGAGNKYLLQLNGPGGFVDLQNNTGGLRINGQAGAAGQFLRSNGAAAAPSWVSLPTSGSQYDNVILVNGAGSFLTDGTGSGGGVVPGLSHTFSLAGNARVLVQYNVTAMALSCAFCASSNASMSIYVDGILAARFFQDIANGDDATLTGSQLLQLGPGSHTVQIHADGIGPDIRFGSGTTVLTTNMILQIFPQ